MLLVHAWTHSFVKRARGGHLRALQSDTDTKELERLRIHCFLMAGAFLDCAEKLQARSSSYARTLEHSCSG
jgi:hypothetical protein